MNTQTCCNQHLMCLRSGTLSDAKGPITSVNSTVVPPLKYSSSEADSFTYRYFKLKQNNTYQSLGFLTLEAICTSWKFKLLETPKIISTHLLYKLLWQ